MIETAILFVTLPALAAIAYAADKLAEKATAQGRAKTATVLTAASSASQYVALGLFAWWMLTHW